MDDPRPDKWYSRLTAKNVNLFWYLKEIGWILIVWFIISQVYTLLYFRINAAVGMFAVLLASVWVRAAVTNDSKLAKLPLEKLLRHAIIISLFGMTIAWFLAVIVLRTPGWGYFWGS